MNLKSISTWWEITYVTVAFFLDWSDFAIFSAIKFWLKKIHLTRFNLFLPIELLLFYMLNNSIIRLFDKLRWYKSNLKINCLKQRSEQISVADANGKSNQKKIWYFCVHNTGGASANLYAACSAVPREFDDPKSVYSPKGTQTKPLSTPAEARFSELHADRRIALW